VALGGFLSFYLVPFLKYPANPRGVGNGDTIGQRAGLYGVMVVACVVFAVAAIWLGTRLASRFGTWNATLLAGLAFAAAIGVVMALMPPLGSLAANIGETGPLLTETPHPLTDPSGSIVYPGFDADVLYWFRLYSVLAQVLLWARRLTPSNEGVSVIGCLTPLFSCVGRWPPCTHGAALGRGGRPAIHEAGVPSAVDSWSICPLCQVT
jgi:Probable cobalt transporter subunit (CbtA)